MPFAVDPAALLIGLREGLEALLILGILLGILRRLGHADRSRAVWVGAGLGVLASVAVGLLVEAMFSAWFETTGAAVFEVVVALAAVGILTYMVLWMHKHTLTLVATVKEKAGRAAAEGRWGFIGGLAFFTVFREGLETVLFYGARLSAVGWPVLLVSGAIGFAISALLAYLIFRLTVKVSLRAFFGITGFMLILVAAGLLVHVVHAASDLGWIPHGEPLWDTSGALPDDGHWLGGPLHALVGYEDQPTALQLLLYVGYVVGVGGWYASRLSPAPRQAAVAKAAGAALIVVLAGFAVGGNLTASVAHGEDGHGDAHAAGVPDHEELFAPASAALEASGARVGVLIRAHGEPVHYNASTYESFKAFIDGIWPYTGFPPEMLAIDQGTILLDEAHPYDDRPHPTDARLVDAWLSPYRGPVPALPVTDPTGMSGAMDQLGGQFYVVPGHGPGLGEGDLYEVFGLGAYRDWLKMENRSPMYGSVKEAWAYLETHLSKHFGDRVVVAFAHHMDPKVDPDETTEAAARRLAAAGVDTIVDAYMSSVHSDAMNTCMMRPHTEHALRAAGFKGAIVPAGMAGTHPAWAAGVAAYARELLADVPAEAPVAVYLAQHGADPARQNPCGEGPDQYHANVRAEYALAEAAVLEALEGRAVTVRHVYGQGAAEPGDGVLSPLEALAADREAGTERVLVIPYEFWGNALDNLVFLRESFGMVPDQAPYYDADRETHLTMDGIAVRIASAHFGMEAKGTAYLARIAEAIAAGAAGAAGGAGGHSHR
jgi:high-affinity iron transporter